MKKHTALTIPVWSPTTVLGEPNPAWLRSSDGIRYIQGGMTVWCRWNFSIVLIAYSNFLAFTFFTSLLSFYRTHFSQQPLPTHLTTTFGFGLFLLLKLFLSPPWFFWYSTAPQPLKISLPNYFDFFSLLSLRVQWSSVGVRLRKVPRHYKNLPENFWRRSKLNSGRVQPNSNRVRPKYGYYTDVRN